jgi:hypothetical protein
MRKIWFMFLLSLLLLISPINLQAAGEYDQPVTIDKLDKSDGTTIELQNNPEAQDVTLDKLMAFLEDYGSQEHYYSNFKKPNAFAAEDLHNIAEVQGIRCAVVFRWVTKGTIHAFNAFEVEGKNIYVSAMLPGTPVIASQGEDGYEFTWWVSEIQGQQIPLQHWRRPLGDEQYFHVFW